MTWFHKILRSHALFQDPWTRTGGLALQLCRMQSWQPMSSIPAAFSLCHATLGTLGLSPQVQFVIEGWEGALQFKELGSSRGDASKTFKLNISFTLQEIGLNDPRGSLWPAFLKSSWSRGRRRMADQKKKAYCPRTPTLCFCFKNKLNPSKTEEKKEEQKMSYMIFPTKSSTTTSN